MNTRREKIEILKYFEYIIDELRAILKDEGVLLFFIFLPIGYPLIYSWIYNNEVARDVPVAVVDDSHSALSREFIRKYDAMPDVSVALQCKDMDEAKSAIGHGDVYGIIHFPQDFAQKIGRMEQGHVSVYCDMSYMLAYKAIFQSATAVSGVMGAEIQRQALQKYTTRDEEISVRPVEFDEVPIFNTTGGYGNFIIPAVLVLIIQQAMLLGVGMLAGTRREDEKSYFRKPMSGIVIQRRAIVLRTLGNATAYILLFAVMLAWITLVVPHIFGFVSMVHAWDLFLFLLPYLVACSFFAITASEMVRYRENVILVVVFTSLPMLFISGISWPQSSISGFWQGVSCIFPSTFAIRGFVRMNSMGALLSDCVTEYVALWILAIVYLAFSLIIAIRRERRLMREVKIED